MKKLIVLCCSMLCAEAVLAGEMPKPKVTVAPTSTEAKVVNTVESGFVADWLKHNRRRARYSRGPMPRNEARVRLQSPTPQSDEAGGSFYTFAIDTRMKGGKGWSEWKKDMTGCIYPAQNVVYIKRGKAFRHAGAFLGKKPGDAPESACVPVEQGNAQVALRAP